MVNLHKSQDKAPLYEQARLQILRLIQSGLRPGDMLPTQDELSQRLGASLITIKRALQELARDGIVESARGRGTIVKQPATILDRRRGVSSWTDSIASLGKEPRTTLLRLERKIPEKKIRHQLGIGSREPVIHLERLRSVDDKPVCLMRNFIPSALVPGLERAGLDCESLYQCLRERYGIHPSDANESIKARLSTPEERVLLGSDTEVVLTIERLTSDNTGRIIEWAQVSARADSYVYETELHESNLIS